MKNKVISLDVKLKDIDGKEINESVTLGRMLAMTIMQDINQEDPLKFYDWALKLNKSEVLELDRSDYEKLKSFVTNCKTITVLGKGQILPLLENDKID